MRERVDQKADAIREGLRAQEIMPESKDALTGAQVSHDNDGGHGSNDHERGH